MKKITVIKQGYINYFLNLNDYHDDDFDNNNNNLIYLSYLFQKKIFHKKSREKEKEQKYNKEIKFIKENC